MKKKVIKPYYPTRNIGQREGNNQKEGRKLEKIKRGEVFYLIKTPLQGGGKK